MSGFGSIPSRPGSSPLGDADQEGFPYGREAVARAFRRFVVDPSTAANLYLTGSPGTGRSTTLNWFFLLSQSGGGEEPGSGPEVFHAALGARGRGTDDLAAALGEQLGYEVATAGELLSVLEVDRRPVVIALGELDEAGPVPSVENTERLVEQLVTPLASMPHVRLVAEGPADHATRLGQCLVIDLDQPQWTARAAFERYVAALCAFVPPQETHPLHHADRRSDFARDVVRTAFPNFLLAQLLVLDHLSAPTDVLDAGAELPGHLTGTVALHLHRWSRQVPIAADALYALALAGQSGLDQLSWSVATTLVSGRPVHPGELDSVLEHVDVLVSTEPVHTNPGMRGAVRHRLRHVAIEAVLLGERSDTEARARQNLAYALAGRIPTQQDTDETARPNWSQTEPVLLSALIRQATAAGVLAPLLEFPDLLLAADLAELRSAAEASAEPDAVALRPVLRLLNPGTADRAARLQTAAVQHGLTRLAAATEAAHTSWPFRALGVQPAKQGDITAAENRGVEAEVVLMTDGVLQVGQAAGEVSSVRWVLRGTPCTAARVVVTDDGPAVLVADRDALLQTRALDDGRLLRPTVRTDEPAELLHLLCGGPEPLCVCAAGDRLWIVGLNDGSTLTELRLGQDVTSISSVADSAPGSAVDKSADDLKQLDVGFGAARIRLAVDPEALLGGFGSASGVRSSDLP
ncbi:hypothetical protein ACFC1R_19950 [Kitasatospora sp. NPDC056138]|uniref:hypothetical protein n=1 Tax=Kitasatospora sp. NPDC056138 TaxID=3345724 RepID=UPI0035D84DB1